MTTAVGIAPVPGTQTPIPAALLLRNGYAVAQQLTIAAQHLARRPYVLTFATWHAATALAAVRDEQVSVVLMFRLGDVAFEERFEMLVRLAGGRVEFMSRPAGGRILQVPTTAGRAA